LAIVFFKKIHTAFHFADGPQPVQYGSEIMLSDTQTGISTTSLIIRKVDKGRVSLEEGAPVSQMQKIALQRINADGSRHYLSAAGPMPGPPGIMTPPAPGSSQQASSHALLFQSPRILDEVKDGVHVFSDEVDDYLCWTIVGICKHINCFFLFSFFISSVRRFGNQRDWQLNSSTLSSMRSDTRTRFPMRP
jgi:recombining binding protein suppressor of hairless